MFRKDTDLIFTVITHTHNDHLYERDMTLLSPGYSHVPEGYRFNIYGSAPVCEKVNAKIGYIAEKYGIVTVNKLDVFEPTDIDGYTVTALPARHDPKAGPQFYMISGEKTILYAHDTHFFTDDVWAYFEKVKPHFDLVSLDCTNACTPMAYIGHMSFEENIEVKQRFLSMEIADESTVFICNHFSHNGKNVVYDNFVPIAAEKGFLVSYDGMIIDL